MSAGAHADSAVLRVAALKSISTDKWEQRWREQQPGTVLTIERVQDWDDAREPVLTALRDRTLDAAFVRLAPGESVSELLPEPLHSVSVYDEDQAVLIAKEHPFANEPNIDGALLDDFELRPALLPAPVARDARQKDLAIVPVTGLEPTSIVLVWLVERDALDIQNFVAIVRGRTSRSSRL